jgi:hypothetical protein
MTDKHAIQDVLSRYVRATDERDGDAQAKLAPAGVKGDITLIMIGYYDSDLVWKLTRLDVKNSLPVFRG